MSARAHIYLPPETLSALDQAAEADRRSRSSMATIAVEQFLAARASVTGASRLADLERLATSTPNKGNTMTDPSLTGQKQGQVPEKDPNPTSRSGPTTNTHGTSGGYPGSRSSPAGAKK